MQRFQRAQEGVSKLQSFDAEVSESKLTVDPHPGLVGAVAVAVRHRVAVAAHLARVSVAFRGWFEPRELATRLVACLRELAAYAKQSWLWYGLPLTGWQWGSEKGVFSW